MILRVILASLFLALALPAAADEMRISVKDAKGRPVENAVVTLHPQGQSSGAIKFGWPMRIDQKDYQFDPFVLIAPVGATVTFPNLDDIRHHVYSFSKAGRFELRLYGKDEAKSAQFNKVGVIVVGCNIHDQMSAYIYVVDTPFASKTGPDGVAVLANVPRGVGSLSVWHPRLIAKDMSDAREVIVPQGDSMQAFQVRLREPSVRRSAY